MLQRVFGLSAEAVIALCCKLDEAVVWTALAPQGRLVTIGLVQTDSTLAILRDDPYTLSGLLLALLSPPPQRPSIPGSGRGMDGLNWLPLTRPVSVAASSVGAVRGGVAQKAPGAQLCPSPRETDVPGSAIIDMQLIPAAR